MGKKKLRLSTPEIVETSDLTTVRCQQTSEVFQVQPNFLSRFLHPFPRDRFFKEILHQKALAIVGLGSSRIEEFISRYFSGGNIEELLSTSASAETGISVWLPSSTEENKVDSFKVTDLTLAQRLFEHAGASLYFRASQETCHELTQLAFQALEWPLSMDGDSSRGEVEVFLGNPQHRLKTPSHTDFQHNFTIQLSGSKVWRLKGGDLTNPLAAKSTHFANSPESALEHQLLCNSVTGSHVFDFNPPSQEEDKWECVELMAGDMLYHPPGMWHSVESSHSGVSLSINISLVTPNWAEVIGNAVKQVLWKANPVFRHPVSMRDFNSVQDWLFQHPSLLGSAASDLVVLKTCAEENEIVWNGKKRTLESRVGLTSKFKINTLAVVLFDSDVFGSEEDDEEEEGNAVITINLGGTSAMELHSMMRKELTGIPVDVVSVLREIRKSVQVRWTGKEVAKLFESTSAEWVCAVDMLLRCGWWLPDEDTFLKRGE